MHSHFPSSPPLCSLPQPHFQKPLYNNFFLFSAPGPPAGRVGRTLRSRSSLFLLIFFLYNARALMEKTLDSRNTYIVCCGCFALPFHRTTSQVEESPT